MIYYIDNITESQGDGSFQHPRISGLGLNLQSGDRVLYRRGCIFHEIIEGREGVYYGAYGEGDAPIFNGAVDLSSPRIWKELRENVWQCTEPGPTEIGNLIFNGSQCSAVLRWEASELRHNGDFWDSAFGSCNGKDAFISHTQTGQREERCFLLYCEQNPGEYYSSIEGAVYGERLLACLKSGMTLEGLTFMNSGVHGAQGSGEKITIRDCRFLRIGGCAWSKDRKIRFGNAVEFWNHGVDILIEHCEFEEIYDSCVTFQGGKECQSTVRFICRENHFRRYGMAAFEYRDRVPTASAFIGNDCEEAGCGFAMAGYPLPRASEIWPEPMGHHLFFWRMKQGESQGSLVVRDNHFGSSPHGYGVYLRIARGAQDQIHFENNSFSHESMGAFWKKEA